jgi:hypothetical protein
MGNTIEDKYFNWLCCLACRDDQIRIRSYRQLLCLLHDREFVWHIHNDENRAEEGICLRYRFAHDKGYDQNGIFMYIPGPCSVLEMMTALAIRCEENIMDNPQIGDRTIQWFWGMVRSLGLMEMHDGWFDPICINQAIDRFLNRDYAPTGEGGLFTIKRCASDLRDIEIWYQLCWYLDNLEGYD